MTMLNHKALRAIADHPNLPTLRSDLEGCDHHIVDDIRARLNKWGSISPKQAALVVKLAAEARKPPEVHVPAPEGRLDIEGEVVSVQERDGRYGATWKMVLKIAEQGGTWLAWMTVPKATWDAIGDGPLKGRRIRVTATLERSDRDDHFAFGKRPVFLGVAQ